MAGHIDTYLNTTINTSQYLNVYIITGLHSHNEIWLWEEIDQVLLLMKVIMIEVLMLI